MKYEAVGRDSQNLYTTLKSICRLDILRRHLGLPDTANVTLTFANAAHDRTDLTLPCRSIFSSQAEIKLCNSRRIGDIGCLRLPEMDDQLRPEAKQRMEQFRDTAGLIIDVGQRRRPLRTDAHPFQLLPSC